MNVDIFYLFKHRESSFFQFGKHQFSIHLYFKWGCEWKMKIICNDIELQTEFYIKMISTWFDLQ